MGGRRRDLHDDGQLLAIRTDVTGNGISRDDVRAKSTGVGATNGFSRASSHSSLSDEPVNTYLSASSAGDTLSSYTSAGSTTRTSAMTDDDRPSASSPTSPSPHAHPTVTVLELSSDTASASALPDGFGFNLSRKGNFLAVYTASNLWLIKTAQLPRLWARTLQVKRKPIAIDIEEEGTLLAVLSRPSQVDLYEIHGEQDQQIKKRRTIMLVHEAHSMALSPDGLILITGSKFGIEVMSIGPDAPESCRRTISGPVGDTLQFSDDGRTLLITGYARKSGTSSLFVLPGLYDGPVNDEGEPMPASPEAVWTGQVLFPETTKKARQATLLPDADTGHISELFAFNSEEDTWGIYDTAAQKFTQRKMFLPDQQRWTRSEFLDDAMPAISPNGDLAAVSLRMRGTTSIWIYQVPEWDYKPKLQDQSPIQPCFCIPVLHDTAEMNQEICVLRWVMKNANIQRLVAVGNISITSTESDGPIVPEGSRGVVIVLDFDKTKSPGGPVPVPTKTDYDLDPLLPGEKLPEGSIDFEREVEIVRTRTLAARRAQERGEGRRNSRINSGNSGPGRARTTATRDRRDSYRPPVPVITRDDSEELTMEEAQAAFEAPYDNTQPRSQNSLARAATVAAVSPANRRHLRALPFRPLEYRRADGMREFPHESDADNWVPPPPAYTATAEAAHSVSLSHPSTPAVPAQDTGSNGQSIPPVPALPATFSPAPVSASPYPRHGSIGAGSQSSTDLRMTPVIPQQRRPSLVHPSTFPAPPQPTPGRRRSSAARQHPPPNAVPGAQPQYQPQPQPQRQALPQPQPRPYPPQNQPHPQYRQPQPQARPQPQQTSQSAYQATTQIMANTRRPTMRGRRAVESTIDLRPPPVIDPTSGRRGSAPDPSINMIPRRPVTGPMSPSVSQLSPARSMQYPSIPSIPATARYGFPPMQSAPPRPMTPSGREGRNFWGGRARTAGGEGGRAAQVQQVQQVQERPGTTMTFREKKKFWNCAVM